jgi:starch synthase
MIAMRYGTIPIVRETGGLKDTVDAYDEYKTTGTGFSFSDFNAHDMLYVIRYAKEVYTNRRGEWIELMKRAMSTDYSWYASAKRYEELYERLLNR